MSETPRKSDPGGWRGAVVTIGGSGT